MSQPSSLIKFARWGLLSAGLTYGFVHARTVKKEYAAEQAKKAKDQKKEAKRAAQNAGGLITDPSHKDFSLEKVLLSLDTPSAKH